MSGQFEIYGLYCPITHELKYIGKAVDSRKRLKSHLRETRRNTPLYTWINELKKDGLIPICRVLEVTTDWEKAEIELISQYKKQGVKLLNVAKGGNEPFCNAITRAKNGRANAKAIHSNPQRKRLWYLKKMLGSGLKFLRENGKIDSANAIVNRLQLNGISI